MTHEEIENIKKEVLEEADRRYRSITDCNDKQDKYQEQLADVRLHYTLIGKDLKIIKWAIIILAIIIAGEKGGEFIQGFLL